MIPVLHPPKNYPLLKKLRVGKQFGFLTSALTHRFSAYFVNFILGFIFYKYLSDKEIEFLKEQK